MNRSAPSAAPALPRGPLGPVLDWLWPPSCALCGDPGHALCPACRADALSDARRSCPRCAIPLPGGSGTAVACGRCQKRPPAYDRTLAAALFEAPFSQLIRGFKYGATLAHAPLLADLLHARIAGDGAGPGAGLDRLVPVPLSRERMASRGFNQSIEIGRVLAARIGTTLDAGSVLRVHDTVPQASLPFETRRQNIRGAFAVIDGRRAELRGACIGVVDDVMTTGATLDELAKTLKRAGASRVVNLVVARTP